MTQQEKELLLKDICGRLPYGVRLKHVQGAECELKYINPQTNAVYVSVLNCDFFKTVLEDGQRSISEYKPYLRPLSSMTEEEIAEYNSFFTYDGIDEYCFLDYIDWLNTHYFDYRGLIEKGLALEAPEGMYN